MGVSLEAVCVRPRRGGTSVSPQIMKMGPAPLPGTWKDELRGNSIEQSSPWEAAATIQPLLSRGLNQSPPTRFKQTSYWQRASFIEWLHKHGIHLSRRTDRLSYPCICSEEQLVGCRLPQSLWDPLPKRPCVSLAQKILRIPQQGWRDGSEKHVLPCRGP